MEYVVKKWCSVGRVTIDNFQIGNLIARLIRLGDKTSPTNKYLKDKKIAVFLH
jgi:hypothetical protein